jgi:hypothetical protein
MATHYNVTIFNLMWSVFYFHLGSNYRNFKPTFSRMSTSTLRSMAGRRSIWRPITDNLKLCSIWWAVWLSYTHGLYIKHRRDCLTQLIEWDSTKCSGMITDYQYNMEQCDNWKYWYNIGCHELFPNETIPNVIFPNQTINQRNNPKNPS